MDLIDNLLDLLEADLEFKHFHLDGQTVVLEDYLEIRPRRAERLRRHIVSGRILVGPWYLQNDEVLTSGESTIRNLLRGTRLARQFGAVPMPIGYVPDQFGHISQLPQILRGFGIETAVMGRGIDMRARGSAQFIWEAPDGSAVLGLGLPNWYNNAQRFPEEPEAARRTLERVVKALAPFEKTPHYLLMNGVDHLEAQENLSPILAGLRQALEREGSGAKLLHSTLPAYAEAVCRALRWDGAGTAVEVPRVRGELREGDQYSILASTLSTRVYLKQANVRQQTLLERGVEPLHLFRSVVSRRAPDVDTLEYIWRRLLENHPHDSICGCSHDAVHRDMMARWREIGDLLADRLEQDLAGIAALVDTEGFAGNDQLLLVYNPAQVERSEWVEATVYLPVDVGRRFALLSPEGEPVPYALLQGRPYSKRVLSPINLPGELDCTEMTLGFRAESVPASGFAAYRIRAGERPWQLGRCSPLEPVLENEFLRVEVRENGTIDLLDKTTGMRFDECLLLEDRADAGDSYVYRRPPQDQVFTSRHVRAEVSHLIATDAVQRCRIAYTWEIPASLTTDGQRRSDERVAVPVEVILTLAAGSKRLDVEITLDNRAKDHRLRVLFPAPFEVREDTEGHADEHCNRRGGGHHAVLSGAVWAGAQFDVIRREAADGSQYMRDANVQPSWHWLAVDGLAVFHEGLHEYECLPGRLAVTLVRGVEWIFRIPEDSVGRYPSEESRVPECQSLGVHRFRLALQPYAGGAEAQAAQLYAAADAWLAGLYAYAYPLDRKRWSGGRPWVQDTGIPGIYLRPDPTAHLPRLPRRASFLCVEGNGVIVSAVKAPDRLLEGEEAAEAEAPGVPQTKAFEPRSLVIRVFNVTSSPTTATLSLPGREVRAAYRLNLAEERLEELSVGQGGAVTLPLGPKTIGTVEIVVA